MTVYEVRTALQVESTQIKNLIHLVGINPAGLDWRRFIVGVDQRGQVVACGQVKPHGTEIRELASIAVHPDHRKLGLARAVIEILLSESPRPLYLMCMSRNGPMYERFGFQVLRIEQMPRYFLRIRRIFDFAAAFRKLDEELLVMKLE